ncbi:hypothetical protein KFE25_012858 [Diacronema lutheri]|uniref:NmrA-like domain-containing protein n=1 Tax=Diacronema lutheri TaxID=2081491 RepID=A0A8J5XA05_DIALT|nr:hypothetical protein KFE25_012858 [Diacronema lutheri]
MAAPLMLVTGASGNVGRAVLDALVERGVRVRAAVSRPERARLPASVHVVRLDFHDRATFAATLDGVRGVFLMRPPAIADTTATLNAFVRAAVDAGVEHVVFLSVEGAEKNKMVPHRAVEDELARTPVRWTLLRPGFFAQNLLTAYREDIAEDSRIYVPAGSGRVAWVDTRDVGFAAARILAEPDAHANRAYTLTGDTTADFAEVARLLSARLGRPIRYVPASVLGYMHHLRSRRKMPWAQVFVLTVLHTLLRYGSAATPHADHALAALCARAPRGIGAFIDDHVDELRS